MRIEWIGHACFRLTAQDGTTVITDPYDESVGIEMIPLKADLITMSHEHHDHNETCMIVGNPVIARGPQLAQVGSMTARAVNSWHDDVQGKKRGFNTVRIFGVDGLKIVHMGDQGCMPSEDVLEAIEDADVMMIPVGGTVFAAQPVSSTAAITAANTIRKRFTRPPLLSVYHFTKNPSRIQPLSVKKPKEYFPFSPVREKAFAFWKDLCYTDIHTRAWWNGRHVGLRSRCLKRAGSSPVARTM